MIHSVKPRDYAINKSWLAVLCINVCTVSTWLKILNKKWRRTSTLSEYVQKVFAFLGDKWRQPRCCRVLQYPSLISFLYDSLTTFEERFNRRRWPLHRRVRQSRVREICSPYSMRTTNILWKKPRLWFTKIFIRLVIQDFWTPWWSSI